MNFGRDTRSARASCRMVKVTTAPNTVMERARQGDKAAQASLAKEHYAALFSLARKLTRNEDTAREVVQETFLRAFSKLDQYDGEHRFASWLFKIATNHVRDLHRRKGKWETTDKEPSVESTAESILEKNESLARVRRALDTLAPETRAALILHLQEGLPVREIAFVLDLSRNAVRMKIYRGVAKVRAQVKEQK